jgi:hypothetical protein
MKGLLKKVLVIAGIYLAGSAFSSVGHTTKVNVAGVETAASPTTIVLPTATEFHTGFPTEVPTLTPTVFIAPTSIPAQTGGQSNDNYYINSQGDSVHSPAYSTDNSGATAQCADGTYSFSQSHRGTCSHHGGVASWL